MGLEKINFYRKLKGMSIDDLADLSGVPKSTLSKITAGITKNPNLDTVKAITSALGISLDDLDDSSDNEHNKKINNNFDFYIERQMQLMGYEILFDEEDAYIWLKGKEGVFEITQTQIDAISDSMHSYLNFKLQELMAESRKVSPPSQRTQPNTTENNKPYLLPNAAHEIEGASNEDKAHDGAIMDDDDLWR